MNKIIIIGGPTASGKTSFAIKLAQELDGEIINADALQVYSENIILSAQPTIEERENIPHHLFGYIKGSESYNVAKWIEEVRSCLQKIKKTPIIVGGSGFYLKHLMFGLSAIPDIPIEVRQQATDLLNQAGNDKFHQIFAALDPEVAIKLEPNNANRVLRAYEVIQATGKSISYWQNKKVSFFPTSVFKLIILQPDREVLYQNCNQRFIDMLNAGALEEVEYLLRQDYSPIMGVMKTHGVPELSKYFKKEYNLDQAIDKSQQNIRNYAKRQTTWFKHQFHHQDKYVIDNALKQFNQMVAICRD
jgi:tRNA dimethylallyltransferase